VEITNNHTASRYEAAVEGHLAVSEYRLDGDVITFTHTEVPEALGGRGVGGALAQRALDDVRARGLRVVAECPFIKSYVERHAEYQDLLAT
jgi:predicted GNAT family acetyltransferase